MFPRVREIIDAFGARLRVSAEGHPNGALVLFERPDRKGYPQAILDGYGTEVLHGYIIAARLALPNALPDEMVDGAFASRFSLTQDEKVCVMLAQQHRQVVFEIPATLWDRLYAELTVVLAHVHEQQRRSGLRLQ